MVFGSVSGFFTGKNTKSVYEEKYILETKVEEKENIFKPALGEYPYSGIIKLPVGHHVMVEAKLYIDDKRAFSQYFHYQVTISRKCINGEYKIKLSELEILDRTEFAHSESSDSEYGLCEEVNGSVTICLGLENLNLVVNRSACNDGIYFSLNKQNSDDMCPGLEGVMKVCMLYRNKCD